MWHDLIDLAEGECLGHEKRNLVNNGHCVEYHVEIINSKGEKVGTAQYSEHDSERIPVKSTYIFKQFDKSGNKIKHLQGDNDNPL